MFIYLKGTVKNILGGKKDYNRQVVILQVDEEFGEGTVRLITNKNYKVGELKYDFTNRLKNCYKNITPNGG